MMVSGPNLNETSIVSGGYGGTAEGIIPTGTIKGRLSLVPAGRDGAARAAGCLAGIRGEGSGGGAEQSALPACPACCWGQACVEAGPALGCGAQRGQLGLTGGRGHRQRRF